MATCAQAGSPKREDPIQEHENRSGSLSSAPSAPATQFPSQEPPGGKVRGKARWSRHVRQMSLARVLIRYLQAGDDDGAGSDFDETDGDLTDISACENLLESYFAQARLGTGHARLSAWSTQSGKETEAAFLPQLEPSMWGREE